MQLRGTGVFVCLLASAVGCSYSSECDQAPDVPPLTAVSDGRFLSGNGAFLPRGVNSYPLLEHAGNDRIDAIDDILSQATGLGRPVVRTGAHMIGGSNPARLRDDDGQLREEGLLYLDLVVQKAEEHGVQLILIAANHWPNYGGAPAVLRAVAPGEMLPVEAFYSDPRAIEHQRAYLTALASRTNSRTNRPYATDPTIFAWELVNEARCSNAAFCDVDTLSVWAETMAGALREAGAVQPIAWGGHGFFGAFGEDIERIAKVDAIDILTVHLYPGHLGALTLEPGAGGDRLAPAIESGSRWIHDAAEVARRHGKAVLVEEAGWRSDSVYRDDERALVLGAWARTARQEGAGYLPWMIGERDRPDYDGYLIRVERDRATASVLRCE